MGGGGGGLTVSASDSGIFRCPHLLSEPGVEDWMMIRNVHQKKKENGKKREIGEEM